VVAFHLIPLEKHLKLSQELDPISVGLEKTNESFLLDDIKTPNNLSVTRLSHAYESIVAFKHGILDVVLTDQLTASYLQEEYSAVPYAFVFDESFRKPLSERFILVTKSTKVDFFEKTKGLSLVFSSHEKSIQNTIFKNFLNDRTDDYKKWFGKLLNCENEFDALNKVLDDQADVAAVSEVLYKEYFDKNMSKADDLRILWYSNPIIRSVIVVREGLYDNQIMQIKGVLSQEDNPSYSWMYFDESLEELKKWKFSIRGKSFSLDERVFNLEKRL